jgi:iron-sulfur cluster repair protein YtfE (RIC family)
MREKWKPTKEAIAVLTVARRYTRALEQGKKLGKPGLHSVCPAIHQMYLEHKSEMLRFKLLWHLMSQVSLKNSPLYETTYQQLYVLQSQWQAQVQLENDILFPKIIGMEAQLVPLGKGY